ncbi:hypothetical protein FACS1894170_05520 [Planctomycetales bacterium]|nr:hypothetical protein FACS1894170_05520 [Planctomycetales bacterium]
MTAFQLQTFIPDNGELSIVLPVSLRGQSVQLDIFVSPSQTQSTVDTFTQFCKVIGSTDYSKVGDGKYLEGLRALQGSLKGTLDLSDLRDEGDREL